MPGGQTGLGASSPDPDAAVRARTRDRLLDQARRGIELLEADRTDPVGRGLLGEAVDKLVDLPYWVNSARLRFLVPVRPELPLRTERLVLRRVHLEDAHDLHAYHGRADVAAYLLTEPLALDEVQAEIRRRLGLGQDPDRDPDQDDEEHGPPAAIGLVLELDGRVVGDVVLLFKPPDFSQAEIGWVLNPDVGGRGLATEAARALLDLAFGHYGFHRVYADLDARNEPSARMCERLGMRREAHFLRDYWSKGRWTDSYRYAILAEEHARSGAAPGSPD